MVKKGEKRCQKCKEIFPATKKNFHKNKQGSFGLHSYCKKCVIEYSREQRRKKKKHLAEGYTRKDKEADIKRRLKAEYNRNPNKDKLRRKSKKDYKLGKEYNLKIDLGRNRKKLFKGRLIQETYDFITLKSKQYTESFLKVDIGKHIKLISEV